MPIAPVWLAAIRRGGAPHSNISETSATFARSAAQKKRDDDFYIRPAGGVDLCKRRSRCGQRVRSGGPGEVDAAVAVLDDRGPVRAHARFGQRQRRGAEGAFGRHAADQPMRPATTGAVIDLMLAIDGVIAAAAGSCACAGRSGSVWSTS